MAPWVVPSSRGQVRVCRGNMVIVVWEADRFGGGSAHQLSSEQFSAIFLAGVGVFESNGHYSLRVGPGTVCTVSGATGASAWQARALWGVEGTLKGAATAGQIWCPLVQRIDPHFHYRSNSWATRPLPPLTTLRPILLLLPLLPSL